MNIIGLVRKFISDRAGSYIAISGLAFPAVIAIAGVGTDMMGANNIRRDLQYVADSAAYSAMGNADREPVVQSAINYVNAIVNGNDWKKNHSSIISMKTVPYFDGRNANLKVEIKAKVHMPFLKMFNQGTKTVEVSATAHGECQPYNATYLGDAYINKQNEYVLTNDDYFKRGWVWLNNRWDMSQRQDIKLKLYFGTRDERGADGMAFAIQNDLQEFEAQGQVGESLGMAWHPRYEKSEKTIVAPALVVEFDTWKNGFDVKQDHTAVFALGNKEHIYHTYNAYVDHRMPNQLMRPIKLNNLEDGRFHFARFIWDPEESQLIYYLDGKLMKKINFNLVGFLGTKNAILGFAASTGGAKNEHKACFFQTKLIS